MNRLLIPFLMGFAALPLVTTTARAAQPNVLFIVANDLNHWVGHLGRNPQAKTPNIDRLAKAGVTFTNAHCTAPACNPSRASLFSVGRSTQPARRSWRSGYRRPMRQICPWEVATKRADTRQARKRSGRKNERCEQARGSIGQRFSGD
jgi:hypothetical protein